MTTSRLTLYNGALRILGDTKLASLTEAKEARYLLDDVWDDGAVDYCLEQGLWNFAIRSAEMTSDPSIEPDFGFSLAYEKSTDWVRTAAVTSDPYFQCVVTADGYRDEAGYLWTDIAPLYMSWVSNDAAYGNDMSMWPKTFVKFVEYDLAFEICPRMKQAENKLDRVEKAMMRTLTDARSKDAMNNGPQRRPGGSWSRMRRGGDRGSRSRLIG